jgi:hypothetical protein
MIQPKPCKDCVAEGNTVVRPTPYPGPRCATHHREWRKLKRAKAHERHVEKTFGLTAVEYADLYLAQGGRCFVCQRASGATKRLAVDHDHRRGCGHDPTVGCRWCVRALLCGPCNQVVVGRYSAEALARAIMVLETLPAQKILNPQGGQSK